MSVDDKNHPISYIAITPLYGFVCDIDELKIDTVFRLRKYDSLTTRSYFGSEDPFLKSLFIWPPNYLLWQQPPLDNATISQLLDPRFREELDGVYPSPAAIQTIFFSPSVTFFQLLRLFNPGRLRGGDTYVIACWAHREQEKWESLASLRCTQMKLDPGVPFTKDASYSLNSSDLPSFNLLQEKLKPILESVGQLRANPAHPPLALALELYAREEFEEIDVVNALTALEALLLDGNKSELTYRLSIRVAFLLGTNPASRKKIFDDMQDFYDLRSAVVHGSQLKLKHRTRLEQIGDLREIVRRTLITVMALIADGMSKCELNKLLNDILFDEVRRDEVQRTASKLLHMGNSVSVVQ